MYADYGYYLAGYSHKDSGLIPENMFPFYSLKASVRMDYLTWGRITSALAERDEVKSCCCAMAEAIYRYDLARKNESGAVVASWSNDGESGSYDLQGSDLTEEGHKRKIGEISREYLLRLGLLNRRC